MAGVLLASGQEDDHGRFAKLPHELHKVELLYICRHKHVLLGESFNRFLLLIYIKDLCLFYCAHHSVFTLKYFVV